MAYTKSQELMFKSRIPVSLRTVSIESHHRFVVAVEQPIVVHIHPFGEIPVVIVLHLDVDQRDLLLARALPNLDQFVHQPRTQSI